MTNLYKVWNEDAGYLLIHAENRTAARMGYAGDIGMRPKDAFEEGAAIHCNIVFEGIDAAYADNEDNEIRCVKLLEHDLIVAGIDHPQWAQERMVGGWWYGDEW